MKMISVYILILAFVTINCHPHHKSSSSSSSSSEEERCPKSNANCSANTHGAGIICFRRKENRYLGEAIEDCNENNETLLPLSVIRNFYIPGDPNCHHIGDGPFHVDAIRQSIGVWTNIAGTRTLKFGDFLLFNPNACWNGAVLAWYPNHRSDVRPFGSLRCHGRDNHFDALCIRYPRVSLVNGATPYEGNVFAYNPTTVNFGPVCDDSWDIKDATVVCKELGFAGATAFKQNSFFGDVPDEFSYDDVGCTGNETSLDDCVHRNVDNCSEDEGAGVICIPPS